MGELKIGNEAREILLNGSQKIYDAVSITLGAKGQNVIIKEGYVNTPIITKDGVTVARNVSSQNIMEQGAIEIIQRAAEATNEAVGDGTTTSVVLAHELFKAGVEALKKKRWGRKVNSISFKRGIDSALNAVIAKLNEIKVSDFDQFDVAKISANGDLEIARIIDEAFDAVGKDGIISIEKSNSKTSSITKVDGMMIEGGLLSELFVTNFKKQTATYKDALVLIIDGDIPKPEYIHPYLVYASKRDLPILIIAHEFDRYLVSLVNMAVDRAKLKVLLLKAPFYGEERSAVLRDIAAMTGSTIITEKSGTIHKLGITGNSIDEKEASTEKYYGVVSKVHMTLDSTSLQFNMNKEYVDSLRAQYEETKDEFVRERIAMITGGVATINIGGYSNTEVTERVDRVEDAVNATRASLINGVVAGGGTALLEARKAIDFSQYIDKDEKLGAKVLYEVLSKPAQKILANAEMPLIEYGKYPNWIDMRTLEKVNMIEAGIIDPVNVTIAALSNAVSVASTLLTSGAYVLIVK